MASPLELPAHPAASEPCRPSPNPPSASCCDEERACWICLGDASDCDEALSCHCSCSSRFAHGRCLARWQMHCSGTREEHCCRFCHARLPDWKATLGEEYQHRLREAGPPPEPRTIRLVYQGNTYLLRVTPTEDGRAVFRRQLLGITGLSDEALSSLNVRFELHQVPGTSGQATAPGSANEAMSSVDAALDLASAPVLGGQGASTVCSALASLVAKVRSRQKM